MNIARFALAAAKARTATGTFGARCRVGSTPSSAVPVQASVSHYHDEPTSAAGGFIPANTGLARWIKSGNPTPAVGDFFFDGTRWHQVSSIDSAAYDPEWEVRLSPLVTQTS